MEPQAAEPWRTGTVESILKGLRESRDYTALPALAAALRAAGYPDRDVLDGVDGLPGRLLHEAGLGAVALLGTGDGLPPAFRAPTARAEAERLVCVLSGGEWAAAARGIASYAASLGEGWYPGRLPEMTYHALMAAANSFADTGYDGLGDGSMNWSNMSCDPEYDVFWGWWGVVTGRRPPDDRREMFSCTC